MRERKTNYWMLIFWMAAAGVLGGHSNVECAFYRYETADGQVRYVDDWFKIPEAYRHSARNYTEAMDGLSAKERERLDAIEQEKEALRRQRQEKQAEEVARRRRLEEARRLAEERKKWETPFEMEGDRILLTVSLSYGRFTQTVPLVLDTGASQILIHEDVAAALGIRRSRRKGIATVPGGKTIAVHYARLQSVRIGPCELKNANVMITPYTGKAIRNKGLLGMNFFKHYNPQIDFENKVIRWQPVDPKATDAGHTP